MQETILVYGWYNQGNIGDELFKEAFRFLFPQYNLVFTPRITLSQLKDASAVFIGGGSFLYAPLNIQEGALPVLQEKKIFYIGVGLETEVHPMHIQLIKQSLLVAIRTPENLEYAKSLNNNTIAIPDIVYCLRSLIQKSDSTPKSVLVIPNVSVVPSHADSHWKHTSWEHFKSEFAQFLDSILLEKYSIKFLAMCQNEKSNDHWATIEILNKMQNRSEKHLLNSTLTDFQSITSIISQYETVITQRFHGIVLSELLRVPYLSIHHHDKLKFSSPGTGIFISYYGAHKGLLQSSFEAVSNNFSSVLPIEDNIFEELRASVSNLINDG